MPHVIVKLWPGRSEAQKRRLAEAITKDVTTILNYGDESVSVAMEEVTLNYDQRSLPLHRDLAERLVRIERCTAEAKYNGVMVRRGHLHLRGGAWIQLRPSPCGTPSSSRQVTATDFRTPHVDPSCCNRYSGSP